MEIRGRNNNEEVREELKKCKRCGGEGMIRVNFFPFGRLKECPDCEGEGVVLVKVKNSIKTLL